MLKFYLLTARNAAVAISVACALFIAVRGFLWMLGVVPFIILLGKVPGVIGIIALTSLVVAAIWTWAQWYQGRTFSN